MDCDLLTICKTRANYTRFSPLVKEHSLSETGNIVWNQMGKYFKAYPRDEVDWDEFETFVMSSYVLKNKPPMDIIDNIRTLLTKLKTFTSTEVTDDLMKMFIVNDYANRIGKEALLVVQGDPKASLDKVHEMLNNCDKEIGRALVADDLFATAEQIVSMAKEAGVEWRLEELNISVGPLKKGDFVVVGARPEVGKTTFLASQVSYFAEQFAKQHKRPILWINNEERSPKVLRRIIQSALGITMQDFEKDEKGNIDAYNTMMGGAGRILVTGTDAGLNNTLAIDKLCEELNPCMIVFDQLDKVQGFMRKDADREDLRLGVMYNWARELAFRYGPVIAASQASESAEGEAWVFQHQLRGSKTDKAGEADVIITIGKTHDPAQEFVRFIHVPKNKLDPGPRTEEKERHGRWEVRIRPEIARYVGTR